VDRKGVEKMTDFVITLLNTLIKIDNINDIINQIKNADKYFEINVNNISATDDIYYLEELSYKGRIFIATNLSTKKAYEILNKYNVDAFITRVISAEDVKVFTNNIKFFEHLYKITNVKRGTYLITANELSIEAARLTGFRVIYLNREGKKGNIRSLKEVVEVNSKQYIDGKISDSALRCS